MVDIGSVHVLILSAASAELKGSLCLQDVPEVLVIQCSTTDCLRESKEI